MVGKPSDRVAFLSACLACLNAEGRTMSQRLLWDGIIYVGQLALHADQCAMTFRAVLRATVQAGVGCSPFGLHTHLVLALPVLYSVTCDLAGVPRRRHVSKPPGGSGRFSGSGWGRYPRCGGEQRTSGCREPRAHCCTEIVSVMCFPITVIAWTTSAPGF